MASTTTATTLTPSYRRFDWSILRVTLGKVFLYGLLIAGLSVTMLPFLWMILGSFKTATEIISIPPSFWPKNPTLRSYQQMLSDPAVPLGRFYLNSLVVAISNVGLGLFTSSLAGYIFAKYEFSGKNLAFNFILATMMVPFQVLMIPSYLILAKLGLINTLWALILPGAMDSFGIFMLKQFVEGLPSELIDAGRIDGASEFGIYSRIILPQLGPALATLGILRFMYSWNSYLWPLVVITSNERRTLPIMLTWYNSSHGRRIDLTMAASVMVVVPILIVYAFFQRWIVQGMALSGLK